MTAFKNNFKVGQRVKFYRTHDKSTQLTGAIVRVWPGEEDLVDVKTEAGNGSISRVETAHAADVTPALTESAAGSGFQASPAQASPAPAKAAGAPMKFEE
jgi:hypothetical protein